MNFLRRIGLTLLFLCLIAVLGLLFQRTQSINLEDQERITSNLRELREVDSEWNINILKSRTGLNLDYDPVTLPLRHIRDLLAELDTASRHSKSKVPLQQLQKLKKTLAEKEIMVERFKSQHAILRNSLIYFPNATETFKGMLSDTAATLPPVDAQLLYALDIHINGLLADTLRFNLNPDPVLGQRLEATIGQLELQKESYPQLVNDALAQLVVHAKAITRQRVIEDNLLNRISSMPSSRNLIDLAEAFDREFDIAIRQKQTDRMYLIGYSSFLLLLLALLGWHLLKSYQMVAQINRSLLSANELLEQRVAERTAELEAQSARLAELATHDGLTGLINCTQLMTLLTRALVRAERRASIVVLMFIDLDGFKAVNDTYGHATGDLVLKEVAKRVPARLRQEDSLARFGGDEFVILLEEASTREGAIRVAQEVLRQIESVTEVAGHKVRISASIGISSVQGRIGASYSVDALLDEADHAMYQAKQAGKGCIRFNPNAQFKAPPDPILSHSQAVNA